jgi:hypothetical protein
MLGRTFLTSVVSLSLACLARAAVAAPPTVAADPALRQLVLEDFNGASSDEEPWQTYPRPSMSAIRYRLDSSERLGTSGNSLHLSFAFAGTDVSEIGFRMRLGELDASDYDHLAFWVKGDSADGYASAFRVQFRRPDPKGPGLTERGSYIVTGITAEWQRVVVPLNFMTGIKDWTKLTDFIISLQSRRAPERRGGYYIDDITLLKTGRRGPSVWDEVIPVKKTAWLAAFGGREAAKAHLQARLVGWPSGMLVAAKTLPREDLDFLRRVARDTWRGLEALSDREHGLPLDNVHFGKGSRALADARIGDYTNITTVGLSLIAVVAARELGIITREEEALDKLATTLSTLERLERYQGFFYNYYDTTTLERTSNFVSFVDSSWLTAGLMVVRMAFPELYERSTKLIEQGNYGFFYDDVEQHMLQGYYTNLPSRSEYTYGALYTESRLGSLIAIGKGDVPEEHWFMMLRTFPEDERWQSQTPSNRQAKTIRGYRLMGGYYRWKGIPYVPSWGGSMFEALMPTLLVDEQEYARGSLWMNDEAHATVQRRYASEELGYPVWGMSPSVTPATGRYAEYGVRVLGSRGYGAGVVSPHAAALALNVIPTAAIANLRRLAERYDMYGDYGFYDAVDPLSGEVAYTYLSLDQAMLFIALANYLKHACVQDLFASDPIARRFLPLLGDEQFFD